MQAFYSVKSPEMIVSFCRLFSSRSPDANEAVGRIIRLTLAAQPFAPAGR